MGKFRRCLVVQTNEDYIKLPHKFYELEDMFFKPFKNINYFQGNVAADLQEQLEKERKEKEEQIAKVRSLEQKILVSSIPYKPSKKSMMQFK